MRFLIVFLLICVQGWAQIVEVHSMNEVMDRFQDRDETTFAVFDIDMVLIQPDEPAFQMANIDKYRATARRIIQSVPSNKRDILYTLTCLPFDSVLVDERTPDFLQSLHHRGIPAFALTASLTGALLHVNSLESWKSGHLQELGICFERGAPCNETIIFRDLEPYRGNHPVFLKGVLFSNGTCCSKGKTLVTFLKNAQLSPREIVFVDDKLDNVRSVEEALLAYDPTIRFEGIHFLGALYYPTENLTEEEFAFRWEEAAARALILE